MRITLHFGVHDIFLSVSIGCDHRARLNPATGTIAWPRLLRCYPRNRLACGTVIGITKMVILSFAAPVDSPLLDTRHSHSPTSLRTFKGDILGRDNGCVERRSVTRLRTQSVVFRCNWPRAFLRGLCLERPVVCPRRPIKLFLILGCLTLGHKNNCS